MLWRSVGAVAERSEIGASASKRTATYFMREGDSGRRTGQVACPRLCTNRVDWRFALCDGRSEVVERGAPRALLVDPERAWPIKSSLALRWHLGSHFGPTGTGRSSSEQGQQRCQMEVRCELG